MCHNAGKNVNELVGRLTEFEPEALSNPYPLYARLREASACHRVADDWGQGSWHVTRYADVAPALKDTRLSSRGIIRPPELQEGKDDLTRLFWKTVEGSLLTADPLDYTRLRKLVGPVFTPKRIQALRPQLQAVIDFQPSRQTMHNVKEIVSYLQRLAVKRRVEPKDDLISAFVQARDDTDALTDDELSSQLFVLLTGGIDTTSAGLGNSLLTLLRSPEAWETFGTESSTVDQAVEELLRFESPFQYAIRRAAEDFELGGQEVKAGDFIWLWLGSANRDPAVFADPDELEPARLNNKHVSHLAFGMGIHYCLGAALARLQLQLALVTLRRRYPNLRLTQAEVRWRSGSFVRSLETLPIALS